MSQAEEPDRRNHAELGLENDHPDKTGHYLKTNAWFPSVRKRIVRSKQVLAHCMKVCKNYDKISWAVNQKLFQ